MKWRSYVLIYGMYFFQSETLIECGNYRWKCLAKFMAKLNAIFQDYVVYAGQKCYGINYYVERPKSGQVSEWYVPRKALSEG